MNNYLETAISLVLIFFIFSIIAYVLQEILAVNLEYRGKVLWRSIAQLLDDVKTSGRGFIKDTLPESATPNTKALFNHPQIRSLRKNLTRLPSYIPSTNFSLAVIDVIAKQAPIGDSKTDLFQQLKKGLEQYSNAKGDWYTVLKNLVDTSSDMKELQQKIEDWYNLYMNRVTGWYKSHTTLTLRLIATGVTLFFNINVIKLTKDIFADEGLRANLTGMAEKMVNDPQMANQYYKKSFASTASSIELYYMDSARKYKLDTLLVQQAMNDSITRAADNYTQSRMKTISGLTRSVSSSGLPLGWKKSIWADFTDKNGSDMFWNIVWTIMGWAIAIGCISMGAPFWFDILAKLVNVRRAGIVPDTYNKK